MDLSVATWRICGRAPPRTGGTVEPRCRPVADCFSIDLTLKNLCSLRMRSLD